MSDTIALMWDCNGLEAAVNVTDLEQQRVWASLKGERMDRLPATENYKVWKWRAQANPQRHYEIYLLQVDDDITVNDICDAFRAAPQQMADTVRKIGHKIYSDRLEPEKRAII